ncbi:MAG: HoxN/HupN/NixA family nickel/cobalt transporter [Candidatus Limnocylindrales bacterium]
MSRPPRHIARAALLGVALATLLPALASAHPLGNFTINHYAEVRVEVDRVLLDLVIDEAEIPAFEARRTFDTDGDGSVSDEEIDAGRTNACDQHIASLSVTAAGAALDLETIEAGLSFPPGVGGLSTMRLACGFVAPLPAAVSATPLRITFADRSFADRIGWREIVVSGSGVSLTPVDGELRPASISARLTAYPEDRIASPLADASVTVDAVLGGGVLAAFDLPDAAPPTGTAPGEPGTSGAPETPLSPAPSTGTSPLSSTAASPSPTAAPTGAVPGGISGGDLPGIFREADLTPVVLLLAFLTAAGLGAAHALTPGHGKTLMAAYLVGTRGTPRHALGLGLSVSLSHTVGILVLAAIVVGAADVLPPDAVVRGAPVVAAISIVAIGGWMVLGELRRRRAIAPGIRGGLVGGHDHAHAEQHADAPQHSHEHDHGHDHPHPQSRTPAPAPDPGVHSHGGITHTHVPAAGATITWRSLFVLGLAGGLIPSTSALLILLGSIAAGRPTFGFALVVAFGIGMAAVMAGIGLALVLARQALDRLPGGGRLGRVREVVPLVAAVVVFGFGIYLTVQAIGGAPTL